MAKFKINPGELKHKIEILRATTIKDEDGIPISTNSKLFSIKAKVTNYKLSEISKNDSTHSVIEKRVYIRKPLKYDIFETDLIKFKNEIYKILWVNNIDELDKFYEIAIKLVK